jgi:8-oxo-dGTP pyrophosphatase MutT (NUDIX family)
MNNKTVNTTAAVQPIKPAATVIIAREGPDGGAPEIFMLRRTSKAAFASGMYVFPGGRVDSDDHLHKYDEHRRGPSEAQSLQRDALGAEWRGYWIAGVRETFEEAGLLLAYTSAADLLRYGDENEQRFDSYRHQIHSGKLSLFELCRRESLTLAVDRIHFVNRFVTPAGRPRRFDTRFFLAEAPPGQTGLHDDKETVASTWISVSAALDRHAAQEFDLMVVTRIQLEMLAEHQTLPAMVAWAQANLTFPVFRPAVPRN